MLIAMLVLIHIPIFCSISIEKLFFLNPCNDEYPTESDCLYGNSEQFFEKIKKCYRIADDSCAICRIIYTGPVSQHEIQQLTENKFSTAKKAIFEQYTILTGSAINSMLTKGEKTLLKKYVSSFLENYKTKKTTCINLLFQLNPIYDKTPDSSSSKEDDSHSREQTPEYHSDDEFDEFNEGDKSYKQDITSCCLCLNKDMHNKKITRPEAKEISRELRNIFDQCAKNFVLEIQSYIHDYTTTAEKHMLAITKRNYESFIRYKNRHFT